MPDPAAAMANPASTSFDLLGPLVVTVAGTAVRLGGPRQVAVLARLLLAPGQVVSMEQLAESVWDGDLPARPEVAIRSYISNLRRSIEPARHPGDRQSCIESIPPGYRLAVDPGAIDAHRFEQLVAQGRSALARDESALAASHLASALRLWRGEPCEGLVDTDALMAYRARLAELRLVATEQWFEARLALGEHEALVPDLEAVLAEHPRRERLTELAMLALYRAGRQSEALAAYQRLRTLLVDQLGIDPGPRVQALEHKILTHDPSLRGGGPPEEAGRGPEEREADRGGRRGDGPPEPGADLVVGRTRELAVLAGLEVALDQGRSATVVVTGEPGSGKSALLGRVADRGMSAGAAVAWGRCREVAQGQVLWPWSQILQHLASTGGGSDDGSATDPALAELVRAGLVAGPVPEPGASGRRPAPPRNPGEATALFPAVVRYLRRLAADRPVLVVIDDAHWADEASLELLAFAGPALSADRVAFAVAWRHTEAGPPPARRALRDLTRLPGLHRIELAGLPAEAVAEMTALLRPDLPQSAELASALRQATAGNPFLVRQMLDTATDAAGVGPWPPGPDGLMAALLAAAPPITVQEQVALRAERAHPAAPAVLTVCALSRTPLTAEVVAEAAELPLNEAEDALEQAVQAGLLMADSPRERTYRFVHPVAARALTAALSGPRLARLHAALGHARWRSGGPPAELVHHFARARSAGTSLLAVRLALLALQESSSLDLLLEAEGLAASNRQVLSGLDGAEGLAAELALLEAQIARLRGQTERQRRAAAAARTLAQAGGGPDAEDLAVLAGTGPHPAGPVFAAVAWDGNGAAAGGELAEAGPAPGSGAWRPVLAARRSRLAGRAVPVPRAAGAGPAGAASALWRERALAALETGSDEELMALAAGPGNPAGGAVDHDHLLARRLALVADPDRPDQELLPPTPTGGVIDLVDASPAGMAGPPDSVLALDRMLTAASIGLVGGRVAAADGLTERLAFWSGQSGIAPGLVRWLRCQVLWEQGRLAELDSLTAGSADGELLGWKAVAAAEAGDTSRAEPLLDRALALRPPPDRGGRAECCLLVLAAGRAGHGPALDRFTRRLGSGPAIASAGAGVAVLGPVDWFRGLGALAGGDVAAATTLFERADGIARRHQAPAWRIRALAGLAEVAAMSGDDEGRQRYGDEASALAGAIGGGWYDVWRAGPGSGPTAGRGGLDVRPAGAAGLQSTSNRFATR